ncbi:hypothetical protein niasHS_009437 [Heterodera schachtii]|uniref:Integrase catalytic domain-containing protein n=3 Tax=Heterodera schachtii TaxID=97005 RepID=A0ABD2J4X9_HETSC
MAAKDQDAAQDDYDSYIAQLDLTAKMKSTGPHIRTIKNTLTGLSAAKSDLAKIQGQPLTSGGTTTQQGAGGTTGGQPAGGQAAGRMQYQVEIAKIKPQPFSGGKMEWNSWFPVYNLAIHSDPTKPKFLKMADLLSLLKGEARDLVLGLQLTDADYDLAIKTLMDRYDDNSHTVRELHRQLITLKASQSFDDDKKLLVDIMRITRMLKSNLQDINVPTIWLTLEQKISKGILRQLQTGKVLAGNAWDTDKFLEKLKEIVTAEEAVEDIYFQSHSRRELDKRPRSDVRPTNRRLLSTIQATVENKNVPNKQYVTKPKFTYGQQFDQQKGKVPFKPKACSFCGQEHWSSDCPQYKDTKSRLEKAKEKKLCLRCLGSGHGTRECQARPRSCWYCKKGGHNKAFCSFQFGGQKQTANPRQGVTTQQVNFTSDDREQSLLSDDQKSDTSNQRKLLLSREITVFNPQKPNFHKKVLAFFDSGSERSYVTKELAIKLKLQAKEPTQIRLVGFAEADLGTFTMRMTKVGVDTLDGQKLIESQITGHLLRDIANIKAEDVPEFELQKEKLSVPTVNKQPQILIGVDYYAEFDIRPERKLPSGFWVADSSVGKFICGKGKLTGPNQADSTCTSFTVKEAEEKEAKEERLNKMVESFFSLETAGMADALLPTDNEQWLENFSKELRFDELEGRYEVPLPWNDRAPELKSNYGLARGRLESILKKLNDEEFKHYNDTIQNQLRMGIVEMVPNPKEATGVLHYLPHQAVVKIDHQTTKLRIVYDGSAHGKDAPSLNQCLDKGPQLLNDLVGVLLRCRLPNVLISADIEKAFLQIQIREKDRDALRFLWLDEKGQVKTFRFRRVPFGLISSPAHLAVTLKHHLNHSKHPAAQQIADNIYVDNVLLGLEEAKQLEQSCREMRQIFAEAKMNLREFASNETEQIKVLPKEWVADHSKLKILGIKWNPTTDMFEFRLPPFLTKEVTKRTILSHLAGVFDPMGLLSPILLPGKILLSKLWSQNYEWDQKLDDQFHSIWANVREDWPEINFKVPRRVCSTSPKQQQIHVFADASGYALGICAYIRTVGDDQIESNLLFAKSLVVPLKTPEKRGTIPRLELQALKIATKIAEKIEKELNTSFSVQLWTDSKDVVDWLKSTKKQETYVENRLKKIRKFSVGFISGITNPADIASRGSSAAELARNKMWWHGPDWLQKSEIRWAAEQHKYIPERDHPGLRTIDQATEINLQIKELAAEPTIDPKRFSSWAKLRVTLALVLRFWAPKIRPPLIGTAEEKVKGIKAVTAEELTKADILLIRMAQRELPPDKQSEMNLQLFLDPDGILRTKGRIQQGDILELAKEPILLPNKAEITHLIISAIHYKNHAGTNYVLAELRQNYWIPQARRTIRQVIQSSRSRHFCRICHKFKAKPFPNQPMPELPKFRVDGSSGRPFLNVGLDYFGPMMAKVNGTPQKVWVCLFTCAVTRGIHLEVVKSLSAEAFLQAFSRFCARRKAPKVVVSDNAKTFKLGAKAVSEIWHHPNINHLINEPKIQNEMAQKGIKWRFNVERAPWTGGFFEKMVHLVKEPLRKSLGKRLVDIDELTTTLVEIEKIVNDRPLTFISEAELTTILRPIDFISPYSDEGFTEIWSGEDPNQKDPEFLYVPDSKKALVIKFKKARDIAEKFWRIWRNDYLTSLREKQQSARNPEKVPKKGEIVIIHDDTPRNQWKIGKIKELIPSSDGLIRSATVYMGGNKELRRPISKLYPMEIQSPINELEINENHNMKMGIKSNCSGMAEDDFIELDYDDDMPTDDQPLNDQQPEETAPQEQQNPRGESCRPTGRPWKWAKQPPVYNNNRKRPRSYSRKPYDKSFRQRQQLTPNMDSQALSSVAMAPKRPRTPLPSPEDGNVLMRNWKLTTNCTHKDDHEQCGDVLAYNLAPDLPKTPLPSLLHVILGQTLQEYGSDRQEVMNACRELSKKEAANADLIWWAVQKKAKVGRKYKFGKTTVTGIPKNAKWKTLHARGDRDGMWWRMMDVSASVALWKNACTVASKELDNAIGCQAGLVVPAEPTPAGHPAIKLLRAIETDVELSLLKVGYPTKKLIMSKVVLVADPQTEAIGKSLRAFVIKSDRFEEYSFTGLNEVVIIWSGAEAINNGQLSEKDVTSDGHLTETGVQSAKTQLEIMMSENCGTEMTTKDRTSTLDDRLRTFVRQLHRSPLKAASTPRDQSPPTTEIVASSIAIRPFPPADAPYVRRPNSIKFLVNGPLQNSSTTQRLEEALSDLIATNQPTDGENREKKRVVDTIAQILANKWGKITVAGSTMSKTALKGADLDIIVMPNWTKETLTPEHRIRELLHARDAIRYRKMQLTTDFCVLIDKTNTPLIKLRTKNGINVDITMDNEKPIINSRWIRDESEDVRFKQLYMALKLWTKTSGLGDASKGGLNSLAWAVLTKHFVQQIPKDGGTFGDFMKFVEYWSSFSFTGYSITKNGVAPPVPGHVIYVQDPHDATDNVARNRKEDDARRLIHTFRGTTDRYLSKEGNVRLSELGFITPTERQPKPTRQIRSNVESEEFEPDQLVFHCIPDGEQDNGHRKVAQVPKSGGKILFARTWLSSFMALFMVLGHCLPFANSSPFPSAMICNKAITPRFVELVSHFGCQDLMVTSVEAELDIYRPTARVKTVKAGYCNMVNQRVTYWENLIWEERNMTVTKSLPTSRDECLRMWKLKQCSIGKLSGTEGLRRTNSEFRPNVEYSYFHKGEAERTNCFLSETVIYYDTKAKTLHSPIGDITKCRFSEEWCVMPDGAVLVWEKPADAECRFEKFASWEGKYHPSEEVWTHQEMALSFPKRVHKIYDCNSQSLVPTDQGLAVDLAMYVGMINKKAEVPPKKSRYERGKVTKTKRLYVVQDMLQRPKVFEVPVDPLPPSDRGRSMEKAKTKNIELTPPERMRDIPVINQSRLGNSRDKRDTVHTEQLASELTASQMSTMGKLKVLVCWLMKQGTSSTLFAGGDATVIARTVLNQQLVEAQWVSTSRRRILKVWQCLPIPMQTFKFLGTGENYCTRDLPINLTLPDRAVRAYLDPKSLVISDTTTNGSCSEFQVQSLLLEGKIMTIDQIRGSSTIADEKGITKVEFGLRGDEKIPSLDPLVFHNFGIFNDTDPTLQALSLFNAFRLGKQLQEEAHKSSTQPGTWSPMPSLPDLNISSILSGMASWDLIYKCVSIYVLAKIALQLMRTYLKKQMQKWGMVMNFPFGQRPASARAQVPAIPLVRFKRAGTTDTTELEQSLAEAVQELESAQIET